MKVYDVGLKRLKYRNDLKYNKVCRFLVYLIIYDYYQIKLNYYF